ncbi:RNA recognition family protein [Cryptosporidium andersoni]|uniref:RNA recognition family protein n=1 Tax=Cryptosporidium andersoni TaxID=117008 RepID=A0A1J4MUP6_9CRYT|nr:RNA recognition family protein [Cryptosporidium andersoni]
MNPESGKIFVGGLPQQVTSSILLEYFLQYGVILDAIVMYDNISGRSRGFGFVTFKDPSVVDLVQICSPHILLGKVVDCKRASPRDTIPPINMNIYTNKAISSEINKDVNSTTENEMNDKLSKTSSKVFVGGLPDLSLEEFKIYFQRFGCIKDAVLITDKHNGRPRGFGFVTFENSDAVANVTKHYNNHFLKGKWVECKRALPREGIPIVSTLCK